MESIVRKYRQNRAVARRNRAINSAIASATSPSMREELLAIANRDFS
ncbi:hypothetical protein GCM10009765_30250 [Fodinicola feengrottensis]|uniref:Uncharacterized protein n=1 Tax=Fodinicola feengrottensis TaxID=435914 RepID=A0ABP4SXS3_9ACTN